MNESNQPIVLRIRDVCQMLGLSASTIYDKMDPKSPRFDPTFPKRIQLGGSAVGLLSHEVHDWLQSRIVERDVQTDNQQATQRSERAKRARSAVAPQQTAKQRTAR